jgi:hypothetical protein
MGDRKSEFVVEAEDGQGVGQRRRLSAELYTHATPARLALKCKEQLGASRVHGMYATDIHRNRAPVAQRGQE